MFKKIISAVFGVLALGYAGLIGYAYWPTGESVPVASMTRPDDKFVTVNGLSIRYREYGTRDDARPTLILIHGFGNSLQSYRNLAPLLGEWSYALALDLPGYGLSSIPVGYDYGNANQAATTIAFADALGIGERIYAGHSMGGAIAVHLGVNDPKAAGLILIDPGIFETGVPAATQYLPFPFPRISAKLFGTRDWREQFLKRSFVDASQITASVMDDLMMTARRDDYWAGATAMMGSFQGANEPALLPGIEIPVLSIFGEADRNHPAPLRAKLRDALPGSQLLVVRDAGHYPHEEKAPEVAEAIKTMVQVWQGTPAHDDGADAGDPR